MQLYYLGNHMKKLKRMKLLALLYIVSTPLSTLNAEISIKNEILTLKDIEASMLSQSLDIKSKEYEVVVANEKRDALTSNYNPKLSLEGSYKYLSEIPEINMSQSRTLKFGDNKNYSFGPTLTMTLFDFGVKSQLQNSLNKNISAKKNEVNNLISNTLFKTRFHYINLALLFEKKSVIANSLNVANKQLKDVTSKQRFGSGSILDLLIAQKEVHELESLLTETIFNIEAEASELYKISYFEKLKETNYKSDQNNLERLDLIKNRFIGYKSRIYKTLENARIKNLMDLSESLESQANSISKQRYPKINLFAKSSIDYPNGPDLTSFNQNTVGITLSMPLFDGGEISHNAGEKHNQALALKQLALNEERNMNESIQLVMKRIDNLTEQNEIIQKKIIESNEISKLLYKSYLEGHTTFIEVERANVKSREAQLNLSTNVYQITFNLIQLANIAGE